MKNKNKRSNNESLKGGKYEHQQESVWEKYVPIAQKIQIRTSVPR